MTLSGPIFDFCISYSDSGHFMHSTPSSKSFIKHALQKEWPQTFSITASLHTSLHIGHFIDDISVSSSTSGYFEVSRCCGMMGSYFFFILGGVEEGIILFSIKIYTVFRS